LEKGDYQKIPIVSILCQFSLYIVIWIILLIVLIINKKYMELVPNFLLIGLMGTNILGPVAILRYCLYIPFLIPVIIVLFNNCNIYRKKNVQ